MQNKIVSTSQAIIILFLLFLFPFSFPSETTEESVLQNAKISNAHFSVITNCVMDYVTQFYIGTCYVNTENDPLTIRSDANQEANKLGTIPKGQNIEVTEINGHWGNTTYNGVSGWVNLNYCARGENPNPIVDETTIIVHITVTGECYHRAGCGYLKSDIPISLEEAERKGYRPCSRCY